MLELCLMASHVPGLTIVYNPEQGFKKDLHHFPQYHSSNQLLATPHPINLHPARNEEWRSTHALLDCCRFANPTTRMPELLMFKAHTHLELLLLGFGIVEQCMRQEKMMKLLACRSSRLEGDSLHSSMLHDLMEPQQPIKGSPQLPFTSYSRWFYSDSECLQSLIHPMRESYFNEPLLGLEGNWSSYKESTYNPTVTEMTDVPPVFYDPYFSTNKSSKQTLLVPHFERRKRTDSSKLAASKVVAPLKTHERLKAKTSQKRKTGSKTSQERVVSCNAYLHACESFLSIIVDRKQGPNKMASLKKSGPHLTHLLTRLSASIAGIGIAVVLSVVCRVVSNQVSFNASKILNTGFGLGLVSLSWAINTLRDTVVSISKRSGKWSSKEDDMMCRLDQDWKAVYFRAAAVMAVAALRLA